MEENETIKTITKSYEEKIVELEKQHQQEAFREYNVSFNYEIINNKESKK